VTTDRATGLAQATTLFGRWLESPERKVALDSYFSTYDGHEAAYADARSRWMTEHKEDET